MDKIILTLLFTALFSTFTSKAIFNISTTLLFVVSIYIGIKEKKYITEKLYWFYFLSIIFGVISNFVTNGLDGVKAFVGNERSIFYFLGFLLLNLKADEFKKASLGAVLGGLLAIVNSTISFFTPAIFGVKTNYYSYHAGRRMRSFHGTIRWGALLQMYAFIIFIWLKKYKNPVLYVISYLIIFWNILLSGTRSSFLAFAIASIFFTTNYIIFVEKKINKKILLILTVFITFSFFIVEKNDFFENRIKSIVDVENASNSIRLGFWKIGIDMIVENPIFGVGSNNINEEFNMFLSEKGKDYEKKYFPIKSGVPFENAYLNLTVENGLFYTIPLYFFFALILFKLYLQILKDSNKENKTLSLLLFSLIIGNRIFVFFFPGTDSYQEFLVIYSLFFLHSINENSVKNRED